VPEIAFVGRSNAGKSTCINTLTQQKRLAFASKTPGRTQSINLFTLGKQGVTDAVLADLPGYGYAAVPKQDKLRWQQVMANYLVTPRQPARHRAAVRPAPGMTELDEILLEVIRPRVEEGLKFLVLLTKADKLNRAEGRPRALSIARLQAGGGEVKLFSALKKQGVDEVAQLLWTGPTRNDAAAASATRGPRSAPRIAPTLMSSYKHSSSSSPLPHGITLQLPRGGRARGGRCWCSCTAFRKPPLSGTSCWRISPAPKTAATAAWRPTCAASSVPARPPKWAPTAPNTWCRISRR
jgi:GTP-binding protein